MTKNSSIPFVGLHAHSVAGSPFDGMGYPQEHMDFAFENGMQALALTDHGNMNGMAYQVLHAKRMKAEGKNFKPIFGVEAYFLPDLKEWRKEYDKAKEDKKRANEVKQSSTMSVEEEGASKRAVNNILNRRRHLILLAQNQKVSAIFLLLYQRHTQKSASLDILVLIMRCSKNIARELSLPPLVLVACMLETTGKILSTAKMLFLMQCVRQHRR